MFCGLTRILQFTYSWLSLEYPVSVEQRESSDMSDLVIMSTLASSVNMEDVEEAAMSNSGLSVTIATTVYHGSSA